MDDRSFPEDPLRVLRGAQFAARFGFTVAEETVALCRTMDLSALSRERVEGELQKALLQAPRPSIFFRTLDTMHQLRPWFTEVQRLQGVPQPPRYHGEGMCGSTPWRCWIPPPSCGPKQPSPWP